MKLWQIYYKDREYARELGDPMLGIISGQTQQQAEETAGKTFTDPGAGFLAIQDDCSRCDSCHNLAYNEDIFKGKMYLDVCPVCYDAGV